MLNLKQGMVWMLAGTFAVTGIGFALTARAEGPQARAIRQREEARQQQERENDKKDHPEVWAAIRALRTAREDIAKSKNEKERYKTAAFKAIDQALNDLEALMARD